jgi:hypothetical protein
MADGELQVRIRDQTEAKPSMREFTDALH